MNVCKVNRRNFATYVYSKGCGLFGALGLNNKLVDSEAFRLVFSNHQNDNDDILQVSAGWGHSAFRTNTGKLFIFGRPYEFNNLIRQYKLRSISSHMARYVSLWSHSMDKDLGFFQSPTHFDEISNTSLVRCSGALTLATNMSGQVYAFGSNKWGQCGTPKNTEHPHLSHYVYDPILVSGINEKVISIDAGLQHCVALTELGNVFSWGKGLRGQLGVDKIEIKKDHSVEPIRIKSLKDIICISTGFNHTVAIDKSGLIYIWGKGMSTTKKIDSHTEVLLYEDQILPRQLNLPGNRIAVEVCCSNFTTVIRATDDTLWTLGVGEFDRNTICSPIPVEIFPDHDDPALSSAYDRYKNSTSKELPKFKIPPGTRMIKGHKRVGLLIDDQNFTLIDNKQINRIKTKVYNVVLHNFESYLLPVELPFHDIDNTNLLPHEIIHSTGKSSNNRKVKSKSYKIKDFSDGWMHTLLVLEDF